MLVRLLFHRRILGEWMTALSRPYPLQRQTAQDRVPSVSDALHRFPGAWHARDSGAEKRNQHETRARLQGVLSHLA